jgi:hypothetical protein
MEHVLLQSSENIKSLINLMMLHEENIARNIPTQDQDISMIPMNTMNSNTYIECEYGHDPGTLTLSSRWKYNDKTILVIECGHTFKKEHFMNWIKTHNTCMYCPAVLF